MHTCQDIHRRIQTHKGKAHVWGKDETDVTLCVMQPCVIHTCDLTEEKELQQGRGSYQWKKMI